jgi:septation ring formation regulator EzrA
VRNLTRRERIEARHLLQELSEQAKGVRNAMDPVSGMLAVSDEAWARQWASLTKALDDFTKQVAA